MTKDKDSPDPGDSGPDSDAHSEAVSEHGDVGSSASGQDQPSLSEESHNSGSGSATENHQSATSEESDTEKGDAPGKKTLLSVANTFSDDSNGTDDDDSKDITKSRTAAIRDIIRSSSASLSIKKLAAEQPDLYGIRRSGRQRKEVTRLNMGDKQKNNRLRNKRSRDSDQSETASDSDVSYDEGRSSRRRVTRARTSRRVRSNQRSKEHLSDEETASESESESEVETKRGKIAYQKSGKKGGRGSKQRISKRGLKQKISYKEESDDVTDSDDLLEVETTEVDQEKETAETIEKVIRRRCGRKGATGSKTTMYNVDKDGDPNSDLDPKKEETELQYFIKWKNWSHLHNTWESEAGLREQKVNGLKKLENFIKKEEELDRWRRCASVEDLEYFDCQQDMVEDLYIQYCLVDRIIVHYAPKPGSENFDYLVKWQGLPYSECTNEDSELINKKFPAAVEEYNVRQKSSLAPNKFCKALKTRPKFVPLKAQPDYIGASDEKLELRDYQLEGLNWLLNSWCKENGVILADEMGLGKTIQTISFLAVLMNSHHVYGPFLLVVPLSTIVTWQKEFQIWAPHINVIVYIGDINSRNMIREYEWCHPGNKKLKFNVILTTYEILLKDKAFLGATSWAVLGIDEAHRLKNDDSLLYKSLINFDTNHRVFITGTPLQNSLKELWSLLHFIMPNKFSSWEEFEKKHQSADKTGFRHLHQELEPFLLRRVKKDVEKSLPAKVEQILRVEMSKIQKQYYRWILTKNYKALTKGLKGNISGFINLMMELKKCCNHAFLVRPPESEDTPNMDRFELLVKSSGKLILLDKLLMRLKEAGHRVLIFSQMVRMLDILAEYLQLRHFQYQRLDGTIRGDVRKQAMDHFNADGSQDFCFLLSTRAGGLGVNLATADTVIIFDSDWNPQNDLQAMARAHRIGQKNQVSVYRLVTKNSVEEDIVERAKKKMVLDHLVIQRMDTSGRTVLDGSGFNNPISSTNPFNKEELTAILKFGAEELFKEADEEEEGEIQVDIDDILRRAETRNAEDQKNSATDELLSQFKVVSFDNLEDQELEGHSTQQQIKDWDDIIPEAERKKIEELELQQQLKELNLPPRSRKQVNDYADSEVEEGKKAKKRKEEEESDESEESEEGERQSKRRGVRAKENIRGFTNADIRRFVKSLKKFGRPKERLDDIAGDAELQEKSQADLEHLADLILTTSEQVMKEHEEKLKEQSPAEGQAKKSQPRPTFKLCGVSINAKSLLQAVSELEPLAKVMPSNTKDRERFQLKVHVKNSHFDCDWHLDDDGNLLKGVYEYGMGNWDAIKLDSALKLQDKILPDGDLKPQAKHLQTRTEYLLKVLLRLTDGDTKPKSPKKTRAIKPSAKKIKSKEIVEENAMSDDDSDREKGKDGREKETTAERGGGGTEGQKKRKEKTRDGTKTHKDDAKKLKKEDKKKSKPSRPEQIQPSHFTINQTVAVDDLPDPVFNECKRSMKVVKKSLKELGNPDSSLSDKELVLHMKQCLLKIGNRISEILSEYKDPVKIKEWRSYLWVFVSKFTEFPAERLYKIYKHALKKQEDSETRQRTSAQEMAGSSQLHYGSGSHSSQRFPSQGKDGPRLPKKHSQEPGFQHKTETRLERPPKRPRDTGDNNWSDTSRDSFQNSSRPASSYGSGYGFNRDAPHSSAEASQLDYRPQHPGGGIGSYGGQKPVNRRFQRNRYGDHPNSYNRLPAGNFGYRDNQFPGNQQRYAQDSKPYHYRGGGSGGGGGGPSNSYNATAGYSQDYNHGRGIQSQAGRPYGGDQQGYWNDTSTSSSFSGYMPRGGGGYRDNRDAPFDRKRRADDQPRDQMHDPRTRDIRGLKEPRITSPVTHFSPSAEKNPSYSVPPCDGPMFSSPVTNTSPQDQVSQPPPH